MAAQEPQPGAVRVAVGMSGGLDSSVVAALCLDRGYEVVGLTLRMFRDGSRCCSIDDIERARQVCGQLGIRHYSMNVIDRFDDLVIKRFLDDYAAGRTPSPCILCNERIKFGDLHRRALQLGCTHIATGHYVRVTRDDAGYYHLLRPRDRAKDQSYFLHRLSQEQLSRCLFPLEGMTKQEVGAYARERGLPVSTSSKSESQDLCFVPDDGHAEFVEAHRPQVKSCGMVLNEEGEILGQHPGIHRFTIGQRQGLGIATGSRVHVKELDAEKNTVTVAPRGKVLASSCLAEDVHWIAGGPPAPVFTADTRIRYRHGEAAAEVTCLEGNRVRCVFAHPQFAVTPGQAAVFYQGDEVMGGGWIQRDPDGAAT